MRTVQVLEYKKDEKGKVFSVNDKIVVWEGLFHQWAADYEDFESGPGNHTSAIVEKEDGSIHLIYPTFIKFKPPMSI